ncbi:isopropylmalate isomerase small subunit [Dendrothele bispora CBS 962.96]|uniref:3-isopropylmalate dehydratase n=1 Tax=Dendrothele bispora (strain CBS 962.96) TaxID=1314807 RepID=A0A4S8KUW0_DENBC|nr:isopropylmalate isomerase small subunit [Dendrothele bispora CBS 962.96]
MQVLSVHIVHGVAVPIRMENLDTDMLVPAPLLKDLSKSGFACALFNRFRFQINTDTNKEEELDFVLNREPFRHAKIMICDGRNSGCGSSREHVVWAFFGDIFFNNSLQNGVLLVVLPQSTCEKLATYAENGGEMKVDPVKEEIRCLGQDKVIPFKVDTNNRDRSLKGLDDIDLTLSVEEKISEYEARRKEG